MFVVRVSQKHRLSAAVSLFCLLACFVFCVFCFPLRLLSSPGTFSSLPPSSYYLYVLPLGAPCSVSLPCFLSQSGLASAGQRSPFAPSALPRRICQPLCPLPPPLSLFFSPSLRRSPFLPASRVPPARSWMRFDSRPVHNQTTRKQLVFFVRHPTTCSILHAFLFSLSARTLVRPPPEGRGRSAARAGNTIAAHGAGFDFPRYSESSKHLLRDMLMCRTSRPPSGLRVRPSTQGVQSSRLMWNPNDTIVALLFFTPTRTTAVFIYFLNTFAYIFFLFAHTSIQ